MSVINSSIYACIYIFHSTNFILKYIYQYDYGYSTHYNYKLNTSFKVKLVNNDMVSVIKCNGNK